VARPRSLRSRNASETGGLSGRPLKEKALEALKAAAAALQGRLVLVAAGGIASAEDAYARIRAGASLVQLYTALVYEGPGLAARIARGLDALLARDGFATMAEAVGADFSASGAGSAQV
jgi:dihydroorotate dehydrogenase